MTDNNIDELVTLEYKYAEINGQIWYLWRLEGEKNWHKKLTPHKESPIVYWLKMPKFEYETKFNALSKEG